MSSDFDKLPRALDIELELLGSLLLKEGQIIPDISKILKPNDFFASIHQTLYTIILDLHQRGVVPNILTVVEELRKHHDFPHNHNVFLESALSLGQVAFTTAYSIDYAYRIKEKSIIRSLILAANRIIQKATEPNASFDDIIHYTENLLADIKFSFDLSSSTKFSSFFDSKFQENVNSMQLFSNRKTGFSNIDQLQIFSPGLYVLGGLPALADIVANFKSSNLDLHVLELQEHDIDDLIFQLRPFCKDTAPVFVLDYLQIVPIKSSNFSPNQAIDDIVRKLKNFQRQTNSTFIVISSFNRQNYSQKVSFESFKNPSTLNTLLMLFGVFNFSALTTCLSMLLLKIVKLLNSIKKLIPAKSNFAFSKIGKVSTTTFSSNIFLPTTAFFPCDASDFKNFSSNPPPDDD